ncbi:methyltransferase domain-containing protein [Colletotrichum sojae]|uniref:Methyltransferase domain-containing protein n=1 Tax=Colletotrichum sojae TaxID=2175907 RepID=A0A8H6IT48_9PEZI|nr:methyltransferase domain-containing protein [Colletotrichum sojae]
MADHYWDLVNQSTSGLTQVITPFASAENAAAAAAARGDNDDDGRQNHNPSDQAPSDSQMRSTMMNYRRENGRTYHRLSDGKYNFPNDALEQERLDIINHLWMLTFDGAYCLCPKNDGARRVLDLGTGTGVWALDYADEFPDATVVGVDLSAIQPLYVPPNCRFEVGDLEEGEEWQWGREAGEKFDFIFARNMIGCFADWGVVFARAYKSLEPGGYFEIHDSVYPIRCDDGTLKEDMPLSRWTRMIRDACEQVGRSLSITTEFPRMMEEAGFEEVTVTKVKFPASPWPEDPKMRELGTWVQASLLPGLEGMSLALFTRVLKWSKAETIVFCSQVRENVKDTSLHGYWDGYSIYGRKPLEKPTGESQ